MPPTKDFDADAISVVMNGERVADLDAVGFDQEKDHELDETVGDDGNVWVLETGDISGTVAVKATSPSIPTMQEVYDEDESFTLAIDYAPTEPFEESEFYDCKLTSFGPADDYGDGMPMWEGEFGCDRAEHLEG